MSARPDIQRARLGDEQVLASLCAEVQALHATARPDVFKPADSAGLAAWFKDVLETGSAKAWICRLGEDPVGYVLVRDQRRADDVFCRERRWYEIEQLGVLPAHRRAGLARALVARVVDAAAADGVDAIELHGWSFNEAAQRTFQSLGFAPKSARFEWTPTPARDGPRGGRATLEEIWRRYDADESRLTGPVSERMLDLAGLRPGMRVLDLGTGRGEPALRAARRVGPQGVVVGVERSPEILGIAREAADREGLTNLDLRAADAEQLDDLAPRSFHVATSRWALMYMEAPVAALTSARAALVPTGVLVAALWAEPERCDFYALPRRVLRRYRTVPPLALEEPGTFRYAALDRAARDLERAGFILEHLEEMTIPVFEGETPPAVVAWARALGSGLNGLLDELPAADQRAFEDDLANELERRRADGRTRLDGVTRIVRARANE